MSGVLCFREPALECDVPVSQLLWEHTYSGWVNLLCVCMHLSMRALYAVEIEMIASLAYAHGLQYTLSETHV